MRNYFFERGEEVRVNGQSYIIAPHRLDSHTYTLDRIENASQNYINSTYFEIEHKKFVRYYTCWQQTQQVPIKIVSEIEQTQKKQSKDFKAAKKKSLTAFLSKKKNDADKKSGLIQKLNQQIQKIPTKQQYKSQKVLYVQLQPFGNIQIPSKIVHIKESIGVIYLLAESMKSKLGVYPQMIPVLDSSQQYKFIRKGLTLQSEIIKVFQYFMQASNIEDWSLTINKLYLDYKSCNPVHNSLQQKQLADRILSDLCQQIIYRKFDILIKINGEYQPDICQITGPGQINILNTGYQLTLQQFSVNILHQDQKIVKIIIQHLVLDPIILNMDSDGCRFLIRYLQQLKD